MHTCVCEILPTPNLVGFALPLCLFANKLARTKPHAKDRRQQCPLSHMYSNRKPTETTSPAPRRLKRGQKEGKSGGAAVATVATASSIAPLSILGLHLPPTPPRLADVCMYVLGSIEPSSSHTHINQVRKAEKTEQTSPNWKRPGRRASKR